MMESAKESIILSGINTTVCPSESVGNSTAPTNGEIEIFGHWPEVTKGGHNYTDIHYELMMEQFG